MNFRSLTHAAARMLAPTCLMIAASATSAQAPAHSVYAPYESLAGEWEVTAGSGGQVVAVERFRWGPGNSYLWFAVSVAAGERQVPHFEGMLVWNGVNRNLDMLLSIDLNGGRVQERGTLSARDSRTFVRDIVATYSEGTILPGGANVRAGPGGAQVNFRQTFEILGPDRMATRLERLEGDRWVPTFPGSDNLTMIRRSARHG